MANYVRTSKFDILSIDAGQNFNIEIKTRKISKKKYFFLLQLYVEFNKKCLFLCQVDMKILQSLSEAAFFFQIPRLLADTCKMMSIGITG